ncbi:hypothetical protein TSOC_001254 [Tetrabaena socialis]|uniref:Uncharacterized protein n=1 Tax=Tetrabaena socialis TaxID=47790 RepID=A0A2J8AH63_9CHLO|nr:hypothetical protein TSOC_001254 [Tetrabaena socialis]|eukprot:PNH11855.1 hypothetical protein TSOC_001254 [Tetrabaena socialis]
MCHERRVTVVDTSYPNGGHTSDYMLTADGGGLYTLIASASTAAGSNLLAGLTSGGQVRVVAFLVRGFGPPPPPQPPPPSVEDTASTKKKKAPPPPPPTPPPPSKDAKKSPPPPPSKGAKKSPPPPPGKGAKTPPPPPGKKGKKGNKGR